MKPSLVVLLNLVSVILCLGQIDGRFFEDYTHKWEVYFEDTLGNQTLNRIWTDYGEIMDVNDKKYLHRVQDLYNPDGTLQSTWINMVELPSMKPWYFQAVTPSGGNTFIEFSENYVFSTISNPAEKRYQQDTLSYEGKLYDWNLYGILLCGLPLKSGKVFVLPILNSNSYQLDEIKVSILKMETINSKRNKIIDTWKVETDKNLTFWLSKKPPYVIQLQLDLQGGNKLMWYSCF
jgi:hypothetical protein